MLILATTAFALDFLSRSQSADSVDSSFPDKGIVLGISEDLSITNQILSNVDEGGGYFLIRYQYTITHTGNYPALNLSANSWFNDSVQNTFEVVGLTTNSALTLNGGFDGKSDRSLLAGSNSLPANSSAQIILTIRLHYTDQNRQFINFAEVAGNSGAGAGSSSSSASGSSASTSSSAATTSSGGVVPSSSSSLPATTSTIGVSTGSSTSAPGSGGDIDGLYDAAQVTFVLPNGQILRGYVGKGD